MTTEKGKTVKKWTSSQEYRDNFERIFGKAIEKGYEEAKAKGAESQLSLEELALPKNVSVECECGTVFTSAEVGWRKCPACGHRWTHLEEVKP